MSTDSDPLDFDMLKRWLKHSTNEAIYRCLCRFAAITSQEVASRMKDQLYLDAAQSLARRAAAFENASDGEQIRSPSPTLTAVKTLTEAPCPHLDNDKRSPATVVVDSVNESSYGPPMKRRRSEMIRTEASRRQTIAAAETSIETAAASNPQPASATQLMSSNSPLSTLRIVAVNASPVAPAGSQSAHPASCHSVISLDSTQRQAGPAPQLSGIWLAATKKRSLIHLQNAWQLCLYAREIAKPLPHDAADSPLDFLWKSMEYYHRVRITAKSHKTFGTVAENLYLVLVTAEFDRRRGSAQADGSLGELRDRTFDLLFPGIMSMGSVDKTSAELEKLKVKRRRSMYYRLRLGKRILELVRRFGYGILVYPGFGCGDINDLNNDQVTAFVTHMECCHPKLKDELNNLSHVVPVIVQWGLPPEQLAIEMIPYKLLSQHQDRSFNDLFTFPNCPEYAFSWIEPGCAANFPNWWRGEVPVELS